mgnify:CR=1 FL=1
MKITRATTYAILAAAQLSESKAAPPVPCSRLAKLGNMPERFLLQVLRGMVNHGILTSTRGVEGGYRLTRPAEQISLLDIVEATEGPLAPAYPELIALAPTAQNHVAEAFDGIALEARQRLGEVKLSQLRPTACV